MLCFDIFLTKYFIEITLAAMKISESSLIPSNYFQELLCFMFKSETVTNFFMTEVPII